MVKRYSVRGFVLLILTAVLLPAGTTGKIAGKVTDQKTREGIPSAVVTVVGTTLGAAADFDGNYVIVNVPPGVYSVSVSYVGYQPTRINNVGVNVDYTTTLNIQLKESSVELGEVVVEGERNPLIRQDQTNPVVAVTSESFQTLPVTTISEVIGLQAGVVTADDGEMHIRGGRSNEIAFTLNGISVNNPYDNNSSIGVATNAVQEVTVSTGTFSAEYGNALSGVVNYVTKEGGAKMTGSLRALTGDYYATNEKVFPHLKNYQPFNTSRGEVTLGGPLLLDNLSFYVSGVFDRNNGYLYGNRIYNPTDFYVPRTEFTKRLVLKDTLGNIIEDPNNAGYPFYLSDSRLGSNNDPYYFNPLNRPVVTSTIGPFAVPTFDSLGAPSGDSALVPLNTSQSYNIQGNISLRISSTMKLKYEAVYDNGTSKDALYNTYRYNPDGRPTNYSNGFVQALDWTHTLSNAAFYTIKFSLSTTDDKTYTYEDYDDPRYLPEFYQTSLPNTSYLTGGTSLTRTFRNTISKGAKFDLQAQMFDIHEIKFGAELRMHSVNYKSYILQFSKLNDGTIVDDFQDVYSDSAVYKAIIPGVDAGYTQYDRKPTQFSLYLQDKIELEKSFILNVGLRYEYFDPNAPFNPSLSTEYSDLGIYFVTSGLKPATKKHTVSPRISMAYPITDQGVIRFSYGHFYQLGNLSSLYLNPNFRAAGSRPTFGNADVRPQKSVQYELGLQQGLTPDLRLEVVGFYKDVRDYLFTQIIKAGKGDIEYRILTNLDYANSRGITISLHQRKAPGSLFSSTIDYTFAVAEGNRTEPIEDFFYNELTEKATETFLVPLDFDRTHTLNTTLNLSEPDDYSVSSTIRIQTGSPYTPSIPSDLASQISKFIQNSASKPFQWTVDLKAEKFFMFEGLRYSVFVLVDNLFNIENEISVYSSSGKALYSADEVANPTAFQEIRNRINRGHVGLIPISAIDNNYASPLNVSRPRLIRFGLSILF